MRITWPRGRYNGKRIAGFEIKIKLNVFWMDWRRPRLEFGTWSVHCGPLHVWMEKTFESGV